MKKENDRLSLSAYWEKHIKGIMSYRIFLSEYKTLLSDKQFVEDFGKYRARKLSPKQIEMLNREFLA